MDTRTALLLFLLLPVAAHPADAITYEMLGPTPSWGPVVANSYGLAVGSYQEIWFSRNGQDWHRTYHEDPEYGWVNTYGIATNRLLTAGYGMNFVDRVGIEELTTRALADGRYISGSACYPDDDWTCARARVLQSGRQIFAIGVSLSSSLVRYDGTKWASVNPQLNRWERGEYCTLNCSERAPVELAAEAGGSTFAYGDIQEYLGNPIGDFVRSDGSAWTDANMSHDAPILALIDFENSVIAAGAFTMLDGSSAPGIARWTGATWEPIAPQLVGMDVSVGSLAVHEGVLVFMVEVSPGAAESHHELWRWNGQVSARLDSDAPAGALVATDVELFIAAPSEYPSERGLWKVQGDLVPVKMRSMSQLKARYR